MIAAFTFTLADASYHIRGDGREWLARCRGDFIDSSRDSFPLRGDVTFLNKYPVEIAFKAASGSLDHAMMGTGFDEQVAQWRDAGYRAEGDAYVLRFWSQQGDESAFIGMTSVLEQAKFAHLHEFMLANVGRRDLSGRLICKFHGFSEQYSEMETIPTRDQFLNGQHYFVVDDQTIAFGLNLPA